MRNLVKSVAIGAAIAFMPLKADSKQTNIIQTMKDNVNTELFINFDEKKFDEKSFDYVINDNFENLEQTPVNPRLIVNAALRYFDEEVSFDLSSEAKRDIARILNQYLTSHSILKIGNNGEVVFVIDNKQEFAKMVKQLVMVIIDDMPFLLRRVAIPLFFGGVSSIERSLDNLDVTAMNMKEKQYKSVVFDYVGGIVKRVLLSMNGNMKIGDFYNSIRRYYPNKNSGKIAEELETLGLKDKDMKNLVYPFKK